MSTTIEHYKPGNRTHYVAWCRVVATLMDVGEGEIGDIEEDGIEWAERVIRELAEDANRWRAHEKLWRELGASMKSGTSEGEVD